MRTLYFSAFAICGIAFYVWIETWAQAHRQAHQRLLEELNPCLQHGRNAECELCNTTFTSTSWPDSITVPNDNGTSITHTGT